MESDWQALGDVAETVSLAQAPHEEGAGKEKLPRQRRMRLFSTSSHL